MGTGSFKSEKEEGATRSHREAPNQVQRRLVAPRRGDQRLRRAGDHELVRREGQRIQMPLLTVWRAPGKMAQPRVAVVVALHGHSAVARNKLKRRLRQILRTEILPRASQSYDAVVSVRASAYSASFDALRDSLKQAFAQ